MHGVKSFRCIKQYLEVMTYCDAITITNQTEESEISLTAVAGCCPTDELLQLSHEYDVVEVHCCVVTIK